MDGSFPGVPDLGWIMPPPHTEDECLAAMTAAHPDVKYITFQGPGRTTGCGGHSGAYMGELDPSIACHGQAKWHAYGASSAGPLLGAEVMDPTGVAVAWAWADGQIGRASCRERV